MTPVKRKEPEEDDEFGPSWIPMGLKIVRNPDGSVDVTEISDEVKKICIFSILGLFFFILALDALV